MPTQRSDAVVQSGHLRLGMIIDCAESDDLGLRIGLDRLQDD